MRKPTVLMINRVYPPVHGATGRLLRDLARAFVRDGWQVTVVTTGPQAIVERDGSIQIVRVKAPETIKGAFGYGVAWVKMLRAALQQPAHDLVVSMTDPPLMAVAGDIVARSKKSQHIHWVQDVYPDLFPVIGVRFPSALMKIMRFFTLGAMKRADKVIVIGRCMARHISYAGVEPKKMSVVPNWPDLPLVGAHYERRHIVAMHQMVEDAETVITRAGGVERYRRAEEQVKSAPKFRVLYAGNVGLIHPVETILEAAALLKHDYPEIEFVFVGGGAKHHQIVEMKNRENLDNVRLLPFQPASRLRELMESGDLHMIAMEPDALGLAVLSKLYSALAAHRPCVFLGPGQSEVAKVIQDYQLGAVLETKDSKALAEAILHYRFDSDAWFAAQEGARKAGDVFVPRASLHAWIVRARQAIGLKSGGNHVSHSQFNKGEEFQSNVAAE